MQRTRNLTLLVSILTWLALAAQAATVYAQSEATLVITELMYHPPAEQNQAEFIELYNPSDAKIDIGGWCVEGINFCFPAGTYVDAGAYLVLTRDARDFTETYALDANFEYQGKLSNAGEEIRLVDTQQQIVDLVVYSDQSPWPHAPDGNGPSLSLIDPTIDNSQPYAWQENTPTPGKNNPVVAHAIQISNPSVTFKADTEVAVKIDNATMATLTYRVNFEEPVTITLDAADNAFVASVANLSPGDLFRYRIEASHETQTVSLPRDSGTGYIGQVVPASIQTNLPILHIFEHDTETVLGIDDQIWENVTFAVRGRASQEFPRKNYKIDLATGDEMQPAFLDFAVDEFALQGSGYEPSYLRQYLAWDAVRRYGLPEHQIHFVRVHRNGEYFGLFTFLEMPDGNWRDRHGLADQAVYKAIPIYDENRGIYEKRTRLDAEWTELDVLNDCVSREDQAALEVCLAQLVDVPQVINELAVMSVIRQADQGFHNFYLYYDIEGNKRWQLFPWDLDLTYGRQDRNWNIGGPRTDLATVHATYQFCPLCNAILSIPAYEQAYLRRLRSVAEDYYANNAIEQQIDDLLTLLAPELTLEREIWEFESSTAEETQIFFSERFVGVYRENLLTNGSDTGTVPAAQQAPSVSIAPVSIQATANDQPYIVFEIENLGEDWLDLSGWQLDSTTVTNGNVIAPNDTLRLSTRYVEGISNKSAVLRGNVDFTASSINITDASGVFVATVTVNNPIVETEAASPQPSMEPTATDQSNISTPRITPWRWIVVAAVVGIGLIGFFVVRRK